MNLSQKNKGLLGLSMTLLEMISVTILKLARILREFKSISGKKQQFHEKFVKWKLNLTTHNFCNENSVKPTLQVNLTNFFQSGSNFLVFTHTLWHCAHLPIFHYKLLPRV